MGEILFIILVALALYVAWSVGANDETMALVAGLNVYSITLIVLVGAIFDFLGAVTFSYKVEETLGQRLLTFPLTYLDALVIVFAIASWLLVASLKGWPVSTTHSAVGAAIGVGLFKIGIEGINWNVLSEVVGGWVLSPVIGLVGAYFVIIFLNKIASFVIDGFNKEFFTRRISGWMLFTWAGLTAFSRGANDVANATAFIIPFFENVNFARILGGAGMAIGLFILGRRVVKNVGLELVELDPLTALGVQLVTALILTIGTLLGLPLSGTHILVSAIIGAGLAKRVWVNTTNLKEILATWVGTFPGAAIIAYIAYLVLTLL
ncbi:MAG: hypothetical protein DRJ35_01395 [Thermoprotei archaeon]|nr:MAG: hypothetical protein DRJ35_01395 [Thermoprotei archaeon]